ncbi:F-box domain, cyclin-like protein [Cynara cardunculus var. scolymus]|uniref:F-box domain, cyclin-like protein n=1 Tax=Cynara cardunculus var. scolymus TaxID=59895 RepID=A0A124SIA0_CYNCS|nr:F-box domain, cyclin-like protein [Cynara cardunculus var. scolymus]
MHNAIIILKMLDISAIAQGFVQMMESGHRTGEFDRVPKDVMANIIPTISSTYLLLSLQNTHPHTHAQCEAFYLSGVVMAGRKRRKLRLVSIKENSEQEAWSVLPVELLELIISRLTLKDNIRTSAVCKRWLSVALSVRKVNKPPWLMYFPKLGHLFEFYDPSQRKTYSVELPELHGCRICYNKDGWLLLYKPRTQRVLFFNPFTREMIKLPRFEMTYQIVAFSTSPKSPNCILFTVKHVSPTVVAISTCHPGAAEWTTVNYHNRLPFVSSIWNKLVFCNGLFYCLSLTGWLGVYDPQEHTWSIRIVPPPRCPDNFFVKNWWKGKFMAEHKGDVFVIYTCYSENPIIYKLDQANKEWVEMKTLEGVTLFASFLSSHARTDLLGMMRNSFVFMGNGAYRTLLITEDTTLGNSAMIGENKIRLKAFGSNHLKTIQPSAGNMWWLRHCSHLALCKAESCGSELSIDVY